MATPLGWWRRLRLCLHDLCFRFWCCWRLGWCWWCWWSLLLCLWVLVRLAGGLAWYCFEGIGIHDYATLARVLVIVVRLDKD